ncbi:site-specific DNA-methyltransferase [Marinospirillum insulare]|uniref:Site-specific DNA-methyltransferase n=1 Tax=Marinospirillum insulare TaxID=217169 RepID=A0ABQ5ZYI7_9GAMM|nr:site-specific DNA-methyltransferase [Marinospirillum insulare]GLR62939.1 site-specific DNA-methyltransferase [Marinospirillum insulare]
MPVTDKLRNRLLKKLTELFQLNQPDLDFGFYRIMHAKAAEVQQFVDKDLLTIVKEAFGENDGQQVAEARGKYETAIQQAKDFGAPNPEETKPVQEAKAAYDAARESGSNEAQVYDHLYRFFERYYDDGDFVSRRYYTRETASNAAPYAVPYNGEEVKLVWANMDQYYIKSTEYFNNFSFDLRQVKDLSELEGLNLGNQENSPLRVHFKIIAASEGEHGNIKESDSSKRQFFLHQEQPVALNEQNELVINFEYRAATAKDALTKEQETQVKTEFDAKGANKGDLPNLFITSQIIHAAKNLAGLPSDYLPSLSAPLPTDKIKQRPLLAKYINQYTGRNTMDYFIHKDLGSFLRRELDFYIKNEVMRLDDIENADAPAVESYLSKIKVLRQIAHKLIDFLAQLEDFQKKLWLKKKFVTETNYCITLDRVPVELYPEICTNQAQLEEWIQLFAIDEIQGDLTTPAFSNPLTLEFLQANQNLVLDTQFFSEQFKAQLLASIEDFDEQCDGLLIHSENFQALSLLQERYRESIDCIHIDPPYNTDTSGFLYKNSYKHSSWATFMNDRITSSLSMLNKTADYLCHIDENEYENLFKLFDNTSLSNSGTLVWDKRNPMNGGSGLATQHEYVTVRSNHKKPIYLRNKNTLAMLSKAQDLINSYGNGYVNEKVRSEYSKWINANNELSGGEKAYRYIDDNGFIYQSVSLRAPEKRLDSKFFTPLIHPATQKPCSVPPNGFSRTPETLQNMIDKGLILFGTDETTQPRQKVLLTKETKRQIPSLIQDGMKGKSWTDALGVNFPYCHPVSLYEDLVGATTNTENSIILDYFSGSGTTGHAVINLNREDSGNRKYILAEMGNHFDTVLKPRLAKVAYAAEWKSGKPVARNTGISHCFKYIRLESYEDTLNNLRLASDPVRQRAIDGNTQLKQDYMLNYMLDVETRGSQSLLNIDAFTDPTAYQLKIKKPSSDEYVTCNVDLIETFNYLIGLRVEHTAAPQRFNASFKRAQDAHAPEGQTTRLVLDGRMQQDANGPWWFRKVEGWVPADTANPNNGQQEKVLIVWRKLTGDIEQDNLMLDEWFQTNRISTRDFEFNTIYVNGSNNLPNLKQAEDRWKVRLIEEEFMQRMWDVEG